MKIKLTKIIFCLFLSFSGSKISLAANHYFTGLPLDSRGFHDFQAIIDYADYGNARVVFVSTSDGVASPSTPYYSTSVLTFDSNGFFQAPEEVQAYSSIATAASQMRSGYADIMLLKRGDTFNETPNRWSKNGYSSRARQIIASYGSSGDRPLLNMGLNLGFAYSANNSGNMIISGLHFYADLWETEEVARCWQIADGAYIHDILIEDSICRRSNASVQSNSTTLAEWPDGIAFRRNQFIETRRDLGDGAVPEVNREVSLTAWRIQDYLIEENLFYKPVEGNRHLYADNFYGNNAPGLILRGNIFYGSRRTALSNRSGGTTANNFFVENDVSLMGGHGSALAGAVISGAKMIDNVFQDVHVGDEAIAILAINLDNAEISRNIITGNQATGNGIRLSTENAGGSTTYNLTNTTVEDNIIYNTDTGTNTVEAMVFSTFTTSYGNIIRNNDIQLGDGGDSLVSGPVPAGTTFSGNRFYKSGSTSDWFNPAGTYATWISSSYANESGSSNTQVTYTDPTRTVGSYAGTLGGTATTEGFMTLALGQSRASWNDNYTACAANNYIRAGFGKDAISPEWQDAVAPNSPTGLGVI
ncbi:MAG: hypothetical protein V3574_05530 [Candidatus Moraniibacteriota bacterium]